MTLSGKKREDLNPLNESKPDVLKLWWAYERAYDSVGIARLLAILSVGGAILFAGALHWERHENEMQVEAAKQEAAKANERVLKLLDALPCKPQ